MALPNEFGFTKYFSTLSSINFSICFSTLSESFMPSGPKSFNPLSVCGLCDAVNIIPRSAFIDFVNIARPFVGNGPNNKTSMPAEISPETKAGSSM